MKTPQRVLSIVGGAFLIGTVQAVVFGPIVLRPTNINDETGNVKGDPDRIRVIDPVPVDPLPDEPIDEEPVDTTPETTDPEVPNGGLTTAFTGAADALLDAAVPEGSLTLRQSHQLWEKGAYFLDARREDEFEAGHIAYASFLESSLFDTDSERAFAVTDSIPTDATIVLYCLGGECDASKNTAALLEQLGYTDLRIMGAGYDNWVAAGFETTEGLDGGESP